MDHRPACSLNLRVSTAHVALVAACCLSATWSNSAHSQEPSQTGTVAAESAPIRGDRKGVRLGPETQTEGLRAGELNLPPLPETASLPQVDTIISDREFNQSIPVLSASDDPELNAPLESIEEFERRLVADQMSGGKPPSASANTINTINGGPSIVPAPTVIPVGDAPVSDPELNVPLPALADFEVTPVQFADNAEDHGDDTEVLYHTKLNGLELADKQTDINMAEQFKSLSALEKGKGKAANTAMVTARLSEDSELLQTILAAEGWYSPRIRSRMERPHSEGDRAFTASLTVEPGTRYVFSDIRIEAEPTVPPNLIADNLALKVGEPIIADRVQGAEAKVALVLPENGYPFAKVGERDILLDTETGDGVYTLPVTVGSRGSFGGFTTDGDLAFGADHVAVLARFKRGQLYDSRKVDDLRKALVATSLFSTVTVEAQETGEFAADGTEYVNLHVRQDAGPPRTIAGSIGYAAGEGITAQGSWTHRNMFPAEGALIAHAIAGTQQQGAGATFRRSNAGKRDRTFELVAEAFHNDYDAYSAYTGRLAARISRDSTPLWQKRYTYAYGAELLATAETDFNANTGGRTRRTYYVAGLNGQIGLDTSDDLLNPTKGYRVTGLVQPEATVRGGFDPYVRARIDASTYYAVNDSLVLAGRLRLGTIQGTGLFDIAPSRRLYAGGGGSVRGFAYQGLGEQAPDGKPVGGRSLNEGSFEARYRFGNYGVVAFVDVGQTYRETMPQFNNLRYGVGLGGRFYTNFGPMRLDVATPLGRKPGESRFNIYVSIGQSF